MQKTLKLITMMLLGMHLSCATSAQSNLPPLETVPYVDLDRYLGLWYEVARYPHSFEKGCVFVTAEYTARDDGKIAVLNSCTKENGKLKVAKGTAKVADKETNAKLKVQFFWPFKGDYWVIELGENYEYAVVSAPKRDYLWILSREEKMAENVLSGILSRLEANGFDLSKIIFLNK